MNTGRPTIRDVAKLAGVSTASVSRVINKKPDVSPEVRESVLKAISLLGYRVNEIGRSLSTRSTKTLGLIISGVTSSLYSLVIKGVEDRASSKGYSVLICNSEIRSQSNEAEQVELLLRKQIDGIIFMSSSSQKMEPYIWELQQLKIPFVLINRDVSDCNVNQIRMRHDKGMYMAVEHLARLGHRRIGYIGRSPVGRTILDQMKGYETAVKELGLGFSPELIFIHSKDDVEIGRVGISKLLQQASPPTGVVCVNDYIAFGAIQRALSEGASVPEKLSVVGYHNLKCSRLMRPLITTIHHPLEEGGKRAVDLLIDREDPTIPEVVELECSLVERESAQRI